MNDQEIYQKIESIQSGIKTHRITVIILSAVVVFLLIIFFNRKTSNSEIKALRQENKILALKMDSLNQRYTEDSLSRAGLIEDQENQKREREDLLAQIRTFSGQLVKYQSRYAHISDYRNVFGDSLVRLFNATFTNK